MREYRPGIEVPDELKYSNFKAQNSYLDSDIIDRLLGQPEWVEKREEDLLEKARLLLKQHNTQDAMRCILAMLDKRGVK